MYGSLKLKSLIFTLIVLLATACGQQKEEEYAKVIPSDASNLISIDVGSLIEKAGLNGADGDKIKSEIIENISGNLSESTIKLLSEIVDNTSVSGVDLLLPIYSYLTIDGDTSDEFYLTIVAKMGDEVKFNSMINQLAEEEILAPVIVGDVCSYSLSADKEDIIAFNEHAIILVSTLDSVDKLGMVTDMFNLGDEQNIYANSDFQRMIAYDGDVKFMGGLDDLPEDITLQIRAQLVGSQVDVTKYRVAGAIAFDDGEFSLVCENYSNDPEYQAYIDKVASKTEPMKGDIVSSLPASSLAVIASYFDGEFAVEEFKINQLLSAKNARDTIFVKLIEDFVSSFKGDVVVSPVSFNSMTDFSVRILADVKSGSGEALEALLNHQQIKPLIKSDGDDSYYISTPFITVYIGIKDDVFYVLNNRSDIDNIGKKVSNSIVTQYPNVKGVVNYSVVNVSEVLRVLELFDLMSVVPGEMIGVCREISFVESTVTKDSKFTFKIVLSDKNVNPLKLVTEVIFN
ncbi:MAG: DUF4836 family protein [Rikenellaceae bacterium]